MKARLMKVIGLALVPFAITGCTYHWTNIEVKPIEAGSITRKYGEGRTRPVAIMEETRLVSDGHEANVNEGFEKRFVSKVKDAHIFNAVMSDIPATTPERYVQLALKVREDQDPHQGSNAMKGFIIGLTMFVLAPAIPLNYDFTSEMILTATRWDGRSKQYSAKGKGSATYQIGANAPMAGAEVREVVTTNNLNSLVNQLAIDKGFLDGP